MRHIIVHLLRGEAEKVHEAITRDLVAKFDAFPIHDRIVPHLTLKRWFELEERGMERLRDVLDDFAASHRQSDYKLQGFGHFGEGVIYVDVKPSPEMSTAAKDLMESLHAIDGLTFDEFDDTEGDFHATVLMRQLKPFDFQAMWDYLKAGPQPDFDMKFDNVAILKREVDKWVVDRVWELAPAE